MLLHLMLALACGCGDAGHDHGEGGHDHDEGGHDHGEGDHGPPAPAVTLWSDDSELFMEYGPFIVNREARFLAHLTALDDFRPVTEGRVIVTLEVDGKTLSAGVQGPARPGIFTPTITPKHAGACTLTLQIEAPDLTDSFQIPDCRVYPDVAAARADLGGDEDGGGDEIAFLKEQQWQTDFGTAAVERREMAPGLRVNAAVRAVPGKEARLTAPTAGRIVLPDPPPIPGQTVTRGQLLARIQPTVAPGESRGVLRAAVSAARAELAAAERDRDRLADLVEKDAIPRRRLEDAGSEVEVARARLESARTRLAAYDVSASGGGARAGAFRVRAPLAGTLVTASVTSGQTVNAGDPLFTVIDLDQVWIEGRVYEPDVPAVEDAAGAWFRVEGRDRTFDITDENARLVTLGHVIDQTSRTVPIIYQVENPDHVLRIGQYADLTVATGEPRAALAVPESALLQKGGRWAAFVQLGGESFERRVVEAGARSRGRVEVTRGLAEGERVVTGGAYDLELAASAGSAPAHGHSH